MPQPIMNPNYFNPQYRTPMYGQFMPQQEQFQPQQFVQQPQQNAVQMYGRIVPAQECIAPNEVPMDGNTAFFPKQDLSEIYAKSWGADGKIYTRLYKPVLNADPIYPVHHRSIFKSSSHKQGLSVCRYLGKR